MTLLVSLLYCVTGLFPLTDSFELMRPDYIESLGFNHSYMSGFASHMHNNLFNHMGMGFCGGDVRCDKSLIMNVICKVECK